VPSLFPAAGTERVLGSSRITELETKTALKENASDASAKRRILGDIAASRTVVLIEEVIPLVRAGLRDTSADVRMAALAAVSGRTLASRQTPVTEDSLHC